MNKELKNIILIYKESINSNKWDEIYANISTTFRGDLTSILLKAGINPLPYMNEIPEYFAEGSQINITQIPENIKNIWDNAFESCKNLTNITIPNSVTNIGWGTFSNCTNLTNITISNGIKNIGGYAFSYCSSLTSITIPDSVTSIGEYTFSGCSSLTSIEIPNSVTTIGISAFYKCSSLTSVTIPDSVTSIWKGAFGDCPYLKLLRYKGTRAEWENIQKSSQWNFKSSIKEIECTDGIISLK